MVICLASWYFLNQREQYLRRSGVKCFLQTGHFWRVTEAAAAAGVSRLFAELKLIS